MTRWMLGLPAAAALGIVGGLGALAQDRPGGPFADGSGWRRGPGALSAEDREAFTDARIAALHAGLRLTPDQEKLWPPVETAIRDFVKQRREARQAARERFAAMRDTESRDVPGMLRAIADRQAASAESLRKLADAAGPLYASLDEGQRRRIAVLGRFMRPPAERRAGRGGLDEPMRGGPGGWR